MWTERGDDDVNVHIWFRDVCSARVSAVRQSTVSKKAYATPISNWFARSRMNAVQRLGWLRENFVMCLVSRYETNYFCQHPSSRWTNCLLDNRQKLLRNDVRRMCPMVATVLNRLAIIWCALGSGWQCAVVHHGGRCGIMTMTITRTRTAHRFSSGLRGPFSSFRRFYWVYFEYIWRDWDWEGKA